MLKSELIDVAIATYNRTDKLRRLLVSISESDQTKVADTGKSISHRPFGLVHISDDNSSSDTKNFYFNLVPKKNVCLHYHNSRLGAMLNKFRAAGYCESDFVALIDSDNYLSKNYLKIANEIEKQNDTIYCPSLVWRNKPGQERWSYPTHMYYTAIDLDLYDIFNSDFGTLLNTGNYIVPRQKYIEIQSHLTEDYGPFECMAVNIAWLLTGNLIKCVPNLTYTHDCTSTDGVYVQNLHKQDECKHKILDLIKKLRQC